MHRFRCLILILFALCLLAPLGAVSALAGEQACDNRVNNTHKKLLECVTVEGVLEHQAALQAIADANGGDRFSGTAGFNESVDYVVAAMTAAGYNVTVEPFVHEVFHQAGPSTLEQISPLAAGYVEGSDYALLDHTASGDVTAAVTAVDLQLGLGNLSTSGCEAADFAGFPAGNIALLQRGTCAFQLKAENAAAAGAVGAIIFNQGNAPERTGLFTGTLGAAYAGGIPVMSSSYDRGVEWATTPGLVLHMIADVFRGPVTDYNVLAESTTGDPSSVVMVGAHLDSVDGGPGINDNGSGSAAILEVALQMAKVKPRNLVRFAWWGGGEQGRLGSIDYLSSLSAGELEDIALYLNFDAVGSPNFVRFVYDGDGSASSAPGPAGSEAIEALFEGFHADLGLAVEPTAIGGSDDAPFAAAGIPVGGVFSGATGIKTAEQAAIYGGTAGVAYDPCYHLACDTFANVSLEALDLNADAIAYAVLYYAMNAAP